MKYSSIWDRFREAAAAGVTPEPPEPGRDVADAGGRVPPSVAGAAAGSAPSSSLECLGSTVRSVESESCAGPITHICGDRCKDWFCPHCCFVQGPKLRARLIDRLETFKGCMMLTFTIDRDLFDSPEAAYKWVCHDRSIARVVGDLRPYLAGRHYFYVVEFQKDGGWPHWHLLVDATFIPIAAVRKAWRRCVPQDKRQLIRPSIDSMGIVRFSKPDGFKSPKHAGLYASKYLTKFPEGGFPDWVLDVAYRVRRYGVSRGFWGTITPRKPLNPFRKRRQCSTRSHRARVGKCCETSSVYGVREEVDEQTGEVRRHKKFLGRVACSGRLIAGTVKELAAMWRGLGVFCKSAFVSYKGTWRDFREFFGSSICNAVGYEDAGLTLEFVHQLGVARGAG